MKPIAEIKAKIAADHKLLTNAEDAEAALAFIGGHRQTVMGVTFEATFSQDKCVVGEDNGHEAREFIARAANEMVGVIVTRAIELAKVDALAADALRSE